MKIRANITSATDIGDALRIEGQGTADTDGKYDVSTRTFTLTVPATEKNMRAFHIGRDVHITIEAK